METTTDAKNSKVSVDKPRFTSKLVVKERFQEEVQVKRQTLYALKLQAHFKAKGYLYATWHDWDSFMGTKKQAIKWFSKMVDKYRKLCPPPRLRILRLIWQDQNTLHSGRSPHP